MYREQYREYAYWCQGVNWGLTRSFASVWVSRRCRGLLIHLKGYNSNLKHYDNHGHLIKNCLIIKKHFEMGQWLGLFSLKFKSLFYSEYFFWKLFWHYQFESWMHYHIFYIFIAHSSVLFQSWTVCVCWHGLCRTFLKIQIGEGSSGPLFQDRKYAFFFLDILIL